VLVNKAEEGEGAKAAVGELKDRLLFSGRRSAVYARHGAVASSQHLASQIGQV
jgi:hypothetical protein